MTMAETKEQAALSVPTDLEHGGIVAIAAALRPLLADVFTLYLKTKNFHWHIAGPHFRDYHLLLDDQASQVYAMADEIAERARKLGQSTLHSIADITKFQTLKDNSAEVVAPAAMLTELLADNQALARELRDVHETCANHDDFGTSAMIEVWIDETERRTWFLAMTLKAR
jgi:starvation-inducible DNA-binding protein